MRSRASAATPRPLSFTEVTTHPVDDRDLELDAALLRRVLGGVGQEVDQRLGQPGGVAAQRHRLVRHLDDELVAAAVDRVARRLDAEPDHLAIVDQLVAQPDLAGGDAADVEQVVDEVGQLAELPVDDVGGLQPRRFG